MAAEPTIIEFRDCRLVTVHFELNPDFEPGPEVRLETNLTLTHDLLEDPEGRPGIRLLAKLQLHGDSAPLNAEVVIGGLFGLSAKPDDPAIVARLAEINCAAIVFPYLRENVADLTRRAGLAPLHLPPINFVELYKANHPEG